MLAKNRIVQVLEIFFSFAIGQSVFADTARVPLSGFVYGGSCIGPDCEYETNFDWPAPNDPVAAVFYAPGSLSFFSNSIQAQLTSFSYFFGISSGWSPFIDTNSLTLTVSVSGGNANCWPFGQYPWNQYSFSNGDSMTITLSPTEYGVGFRCLPKDYKDGVPTVMIQNMTVNYTRHVDLSASTPYADRPLVVGIPQTVIVPVFGQGFVQSNSGGSVNVTLQAGSHFYHQSLSLAGFADYGVAGNWIYVPFTVLFDPAEVGDQTLIATVDPENSLNETDTTNNEASTSTYVGFENDFSIESIQVAQGSQPSIVSDSDGFIDLIAGQPATVNTFVTASNFNATDSSTVSLWVTLGCMDTDLTCEMIDYQYIPVSSIGTTGTTISSMFTPSFSGSSHILAGFYPDNDYDPNYDNNYKIISVRIANLDLAVSTPQVSQTGATISPSDGLLQVGATMPAQINVPISGSGFNSPETRSTTVTLQAGLHNYSQNISLSAVQSAGGTLNVPFTVTFDPSDTGVQTITATIDPENALNETNFSNNTASIQVKVGRTVKLVKTVTKEDGTQQDPDWFTMIPSVQVFGTHCSSAANHSEYRTITLKCVDATNSEAVDGCAVALSAKTGSITGGHDPLTHGRRPLFESLTFTANDSDVALGTPIPIPTSGLSIDYEAPQPAGEVIMSFDLKYSQGMAKPPTDTYIEVQAAETYISLKPADTGQLTTGLEFVNFNSHPSDGWYGTRDMMITLSQLIGNYLREATDTFGVDNPDYLYSEAASLSLGGVFDIKHHWTDPHCGHRDGRTLDISVSNLQNDPGQLAALKAALMKTHVKWKLESNPPHYHVQQ